MRAPIITNLKAWIDHRTVGHLPAVGLSRQCAYRGGKCDNERYARYTRAIGSMGIAGTLNLTWHNRPRQVEGRATDGEFVGRELAEQHRASRFQPLRDHGVPTCDVA